MDFRNPYIYVPFIAGKNVSKIYSSAVLCWVARSCPTLRDPMDCSPPSSVHGDSPGKNSGVSGHALLQGIFPTQGWNPENVLLFTLYVYDNSK